MKKIFITGGSGLVGSRFIELLSREYSISSPSHQQLDLLDFDAVEKIIHHINPDILINFAAVTNLDQAEAEKDNKNGQVYRLNALLPQHLSILSTKFGFHLIQISTDYVFDGAKAQRPYKEEDEVNPLCWYAKTKLEAEYFVQKHTDSFTIARIEMPFSENFNGKKDFARFFLESLESGKPLSVVEDQRITPIYVDDCVLALDRIIQKPLKGIFHIASINWTTPFQFAQNLASLFDLDARQIKPVKFSEFNQYRIAPRPKDSWLDVSKFESIYGKGTLEPIEDELLLFKSKRV